MVPFSLFLASKYLKPKRTFVSVVMVISMIGVMLGVAILIIVMSVMSGFDEMWRDKILSFKPHITVTSFEGIIDDPDDLCAKLDSVKGVTGVAPSIETRVLMQYNKRTVAPVVLGLDPVRAAQVSRIPDYIRAGEFSIDDESVMVGIDLASSLGLGLGSKPLLYSPMNVISPDEMYLPEELAVTGVFDIGMRDFDAGFVITSITVARTLVGLDRGAHSIYIMTDDPFKFAEYADNIARVVGPAYNVRTWKEIDSLMFEALSHEKGMMGALLAIITIVAIFCVTNTLIVITYQKTNEIGLLKALGVPSLKIMGAFIILGWIQCVAGIVLGVGMAHLVLHNLSNLCTWLAQIDVNAFPKEIYGLSQIPWLWSWREVGNISVLVMVFCSITSAAPAARALWLDPVEALRHE